MEQSSTRFPIQLFSSLRDLNETYQVEHVVSDLVQRVELVHLQDKSRKAEDFAAVSRTVGRKLLRHIDVIQKDRTRLIADNMSIKEKAKSVREKFAVDITQVLRDNRQLNEVRSALRECAIKNQEYIAKIKALEEENAGLRIELTPSAPAVEPKKFTGLGTIFAECPDVYILNMFSYLDTVEVLNVAQVNRYLFWRVDTMFGTNSETVQANWSRKPLCFGGDVEPEEVQDDKRAGDANRPNESSVAIDASSASQSSTAELRELATALTKKLTPAEMSAIIAWNSKLAAVSNQLASVSTERDELKSKLTVRRYLLPRLFICPLCQMFSYCRKLRMFEIS
jgi:hypothetical protein